MKMRSKPTLWAKITVARPALGPYRQTGLRLLNICPLNSRMTVYTAKNSILDQAAAADAIIVLEIPFAIRITKSAHVRLAITDTVSPGLTVRASV